ncbi:MAG: mechanosensitive ion channel [Betaproteobacteria bacterium]|nr:mechanosensitive ion channel [Betaproteobacteria bacterium]
MFRLQIRRDVGAVLYLLGLLLSSGLLLTGNVVAQSPGATVAAAKTDLPAASQKVTSADALKARLKALEGQQDIPADEKAKVVELLTQAVAAAERADALKIESEGLTDELRLAPERLAEIQKALAMSLPTFDSDELMAKTPAADAETKLRETEANLATARQKVNSLTDALALQRQRPEVLQSSLAEAKGRLATIAEEIKTPSVAGEPSGVVEARQSALEARQRMRNAEIGLFEQQLASHDQRLALLTAELELAQREAATSESAMAAWQAVVQRHREIETAAKIKEAEAIQQSLAAMPEKIRAVAERNTVLAAELQELGVKEADLTRRLTLTEARLKEVAEDFIAVQERVKLAGLNDTIALVLRKQRDALPSMSDYRSQARKIRAETSRSAGRQLDHEETRRDLADPAQAATRIIDAIEPAIGESAKADMLPRVSELLQKQRELATNLHADYGRYIKQLGKLDNAGRTLVSRAEEFNRLIDEHLLWIRSAPPVSGATLARAAPALAWLATPARWTGVARDLWRSVSAAPFAWAAGLVALVLAFSLRGRAKSEFARTAALVEHVTTDSLFLTLRAFIATLVLASAWPLLAVAVGWPLVASDMGDPFSRAIGSGLLALALMGFGFALLRGLARDGGLGDAHFGWPAAARQDLRRNLRWLAMIVLPLGFVIWTLETFDDEAQRASLGRITFVLAMLALTVFIARVLRPHGALLTALVTRHPAGLITRLKYLWIFPAVAAPFSLAVLSIFGYYFSAVQLQNRLQATAWIVIALVIVSEYLMRWLYVSHRRLAHEQMLEEQEKAHRDQAQPEALEEDQDELVEFEEPEIDLDAIQTQTGSLIRTVMGVVAIIGLWITWASVLPALHVLDEIPLWSYPGEIDGVQRLVPVTLVDVGFALIVAGLTYLGTKNLPGALELAVLNRTSLDAGAKYAFTTLCRYVIAATGIILVFSYLGMQWSRLQFLLAALGVGLGFGLQEIVANFISGLILLFERPIRVGDIVTINGSSGTVSRIRIRATTITDWDRKELIVPNKRFITGEVLNWTLSNELNRILINVGVAYGADTDRARELLVQIAQKHPRILEDPPPIASFEGFGDNTLNLALRCYMPTLDGRLGVITELHSAIDAAFKEAGIEIAFPQRDIHFDTKQPLEVRMVSEGAWPQTSKKAAGDG